MNPSTETQYPRGLLIETSEDGTRWTPAWEGLPGNVLLETALGSGLPGTRMTFASRQARFVRLTETLTDEAAPWSIVEVHVLRAP
jgi:hypothetical protein